MMQPPAKDASLGEGGVKRYEGFQRAGSRMQREDNVRCEESTNSRDVKSKSLEPSEGYLLAMRFGSSNARMEDDVDIVEKKVTENKSMTISEDCAPLQNVFLHTVDGYQMDCLTTKNDGVFEGRVASDMELIQLTPVVNTWFENIRVLLNDVVISPSMQTTLELDYGDNTFSLIVEYLENAETIVADQYMISIKREHNIAPASYVESMKSISHEEEMSEEDSLVKDLKFGAENIKKLEEQLEKLEKHFATTFNLPEDEGDKQKQTPHSTNKVARTQTPNSPLLLNTSDNEESVHSCDSKTGGTPKKTKILGNKSFAGFSPSHISHLQTPKMQPKAMRVRSPASPNRKMAASSPKEETPSSQLRGTCERINSIKSTFHDSAARKKSHDERILTQAFDRIAKLEKQMHVQDNSHQKEMKSVRTEMSQAMNENKQDMLHKQSTFEKSVNEKLLNMRQSLHTFSTSFFDKIAEEKMLIEEKSQGIEHKLCEKIESISLLLQNIQNLNAKSKEAFSRDIGELRGMHNTTSKRLATQESNSLTLSQSLLLVDRRLKTAEYESEKFKVSANADIAALEELIHAEKKQRQNEDAEIIKALHMYADTFTDTLKIDHIC